LRLYGASPTITFAASDESAGCSLTHDDANGRIVSTCPLVGPSGTGRRLDESLEALETPLVDKQEPKDESPRDQDQQEVPVDQRGDNALKAELSTVKAELSTVKAELARLQVKLASFAAIVDELVLMKDKPGEH